MRTGIGRTFQAASVFDELTVLENVDPREASFTAPRLPLADTAPQGIVRQRR